MHGRRGARSMGVHSCGYERTVSPWFVIGVQQPDITVLEADASASIDTHPTADDGAIDGNMIRISDDGPRAESQHEPKWRAHDIVMSCARRTSLARDTLECRSPFVGERTPHP